MIGHLLSISRGVRHFSSTMSRIVGAVSFNNRNGKPCGEVVVAPVDAAECDRSGYLSVDRLNRLVFRYRRQIYRNAQNSDQYGLPFRQLKEMNTNYLTFLTTVKTVVSDHNYVSKWRREFSDTDLLLRVQLLHVGKTSYSIRNELVHFDDEDCKLAVVVHHVTLVDSGSRRPVAVPESFAEQGREFALVDGLPYRVTLTDVQGPCHTYSTRVRWTDTDGYNHLNTLVYLKFTYDAFYDALNEGKFKEFTDSEGILRVEDFKMRFIKECLHGQNLEIELWEGSVGTLNVRMKVDGQIVNESLMTSKDHPSTQEAAAQL